jgi:hypothetical protein
MQRAARVTFAALVLWAGTAGAAYRDGFETPNLAWRLADSDCRARLIAHERTFHPPAVHSGAGAEYLRLHTEQGSTAHLSLAIPPARVIQELRPSLWVKATRTGIQLRGRVILPRSRDPRDGSMLAVWVEGEVYDQPSGWRRLAIRDLPLQVRRQVWIKRGQPQSGAVDEREAYLDLIVLNAYTSPGITDLWIDDLEVEGFTEAINPDLPYDPASDDGVRTEQPPLDESPLLAAALAVQQSPHLEGSTLIAGQGPLALRMIEHRGESLVWLKSLGFNGVRLSRPAEPEVMEQARRLDLWLVAPPPHSSRGDFARGEITAAHDRVAAWDMGSDLGVRDLESLRLLARDVRRDDRRETRPILAGPREQFWGYRRFADVLLLGDAPLGTARNIADFRSQIVEQARHGARPGPVWANVQTAPSASLLEQLSAIGEGQFHAPLEADQVRLLVLAALEAGATGFCFRSPGSLDAGDPAAQHRAAVLHALNLELSLVEPWIAGSSPRETLDLGSDDLRATLWSAERSKLILLTRHFTDDQFTAAPAPPQPVSLLLSGAPPSWKAYRIGADRLTPVSSSQVGGGMRINVSDLARGAWIVVADDPLTMNFLGRRLRQSLAPRAKLRHEILARELALAEQVLAAAPSDAAARDEGVRGLEEARQAMRQCERLLDAADFAGSLEMAERAQQSLAHVRRRMWWGAANAFASRVASPCCSAFAALPLHWSLAQRVHAATWGPNSLVAGDFEDVRLMQSTGWTQERDLNRQAAALVELSPDRPQQGRYSLRLRYAETAASAEAELPHAPPIRITTPATRLNAGEIVRISGWLRGAPHKDPPPLLRVRDSLGGESLADYLTPSSEWRPFVLYRAAPRPAQLTIVLELLGPGDVWVDSVSVETLRSPLLQKFGPSTAGR